MRFLKRLTFCLGLVLGLATVAVAGAVTLTYLFTDRFPVVNVSKDGSKVTLMTPEEVATLVREQMKKVAAAKTAQPAGGTNDG
jgi:hypothetical protein